MSLLSTLGGIIIGTLLLMLSSKILKQQKVFLPSLKVVAIISIIGFLISLFNIGFGLSIFLGILVLVLEIFLIKKFFNVKTGRAIGIWAIMLAFMIVLSVLLTAVLWGIIASKIAGASSGIDLSQFSKI